MSKIYLSSEVNISVAGIPIHRSGGYADGEFLRIEFDSDSVTDAVGTDGEVVASMSNDNRALATIILMQSSDGNDLLSALFKRQQASKLKQGIGSFQVTDKSGRSLYNAPKSAIRKLPNGSFGKEAATREWPIRLFNCIATIGGNMDML